ncbi:MAG: TonB-dependent receptor plug domain-containing protein [Bacteroidota bacterium]|jgi:hemoglobin/transferrin/lactoferrin receptor protein
MRLPLFHLLLLWVVFSGCFQKGFSQIVVVRDSATSMPLEFVTASSQKPFATTVTNTKGQADLTAFAGSERIEFRLLGYKTETRSYDELERNGFALRMVVSGISLDELVVSATKWNTSSNRTPFQVISITPAQVQLAQTQTAADLLGLTGGVYIQKSQQAGGSPMIRGFAANRLLYSVDGVRMNTAIFRSGNLQNVISLDPFSIEKTEVLFGPGSVLYGSDAIGGVMLFQTHTPYLSTNDSLLVSSKASYRYASANNESTIHAHASVGGRKSAFLLSYTHFDYDDLRMGSKGPEDYLNGFYVVRENDTDKVVANENPLLQRNTGYYQDNMNARFKWIPSEQSVVDVGFYYSATGSYSRYDRLIRTSKSGLPSSAEWYYGPQQWMMARASFEHTGDGSEYDQMRIQAAWQRFKESRNDRNFGDFVLRNRVENVDAFSANIDFRKNFRNYFELHYGLEFIANKVESAGTNKDISSGISVNGPSRYPDSDWSSFAGYLTVEFELGLRSVLTAGARWNGFSLKAQFDTTFYPFPFTKADLNNMALTGSLGWNYQLSDRWQFTSTGSTGFRAPNVDDMGKVFDISETSVVVPNPDLDPEYAWNFELGINGSIKEKIHLDFSAFHTWLDDAMVRRDFQLNGLDSILYDGNNRKVQAIQNSAKAKVYGAHLNVSAALHTDWVLKTSLNYQKGEEELDDGTTAPLRHATPFFGTVKLAYRKKSFHAELALDFSSKIRFEDMPTEYLDNLHLFAKDKSGNPYAPSWHIYSIKTKYTFLKAYTVSLGLENILDTRYRTFGSGLAAPGRSVTAGLHLAF